MGIAASFTIDLDGDVPMIHCSTGRSIAVPPEVIDQCDADGVGGDSDPIDLLLSFARKQGLHLPQVTSEAARDGDAPAGLSRIGACRRADGWAAPVGDPGPRGGRPAA